MSENQSATAPPANQPPRRLFFMFLAALAATILLTVAVTALLVSIIERKREAQQPYFQVVAVDETTTDPEPWARNWPRQFDRYQRTVDVTHTRFGGSSAMPQQKLDREPWLRRLYAGYAFSIDYRERRGHAYMLHDQEQTERVMQRPQAGACLHCHASIVPTWRRLGLEAMGKPADAAALAADFNWPAVNKGFEIASLMRYADAHAELLKTPDGTPNENVPLMPGGTGKPGAVPGPTTREMLASHVGEAHPVSCVDCHDPRSMQIRITRPGFVRGIQALAESKEPLPHLPSVERWRQGNRAKPYDPNAQATRQEMRSFVCGQCHVEYYCAPKEVIFFPWGKGMKAEQIEAYYEEHKFPDGTPFMDYKHGETGAPSYKAQHPEFELWSQGVHARSGVACADCHMPYIRDGAMKISDHWVRSPLLMVNNSCQTCHNFPEAEITARVEAIQTRTSELIKRSAEAMTDMLDAIRGAQAAGVDLPALGALYKLQRQAQWRLDFIASENSMGFHAPQEAARVLAEAIDYARQAQVLAEQLAPGATTRPSTRPVVPVQGVTPAERPR